MDESENSSLEILSNNSSSNDNCERKGTVNRAANKDLKIHNSVIKPTEEEYELYIEMFSELSDVLRVQINCTACGKNLNKIVATGNAVFCHPQLRVLMCNKCHTFYGDGEFSVDEDGSVNYCRLCGQGGTLYCCSECISAFCKACLKRNLSKVDLEITESEDWKCLMCNCKPIWKNRSICWAAQQYISEFQRKKKKEKLANLQKLIKSKEESSQSKKRKRNSYSYLRRTSRRDSSTKNNSVEVICVKTSNDEADSSDVDNESSKTRSNSHKKYKIDNCSNKNISRNNVNVHAIKVEASERDDSETSSEKASNGNTSKIRKIDHFEKVSSLTQDMKAAKKTSVWISEYLKDIISIGELISNEAKKMLETNVSISKLAKCSQVNKIIHKINLLTNLSCKNLKKVKCISNAAHIHWVEKVKSQISTPKAKAKITNTGEKTSNSEEDDSNCEEHCVVKSEDTIQQCILSDIIGNKEHEENAKNNSPSSHNMNQNACFQHDKSNIKEFEETDTRVSNSESENNTSDRLHSLEFNRNESDEKNNIGNKHEKERREICNTSSKKIACERLDSSEEKIESDKSESDKEKAMKHSDEHLTAKEISESTLSKNNSLCKAEIAEEKNEIKKHDLHVANILSLSQADDNEANNFIQKVDKNNIEENNSDSACEIKNNAHATEKSEKERIKLLHESEYNDINSEIRTDDFVSISNEQFDCVSNVESSSLPAEQCPKLTEKCSDAKRELLESSMDESLSDETSDGEYTRKPNLHKSSEQNSCPERKQRRKTKNLGKKSDLKLNHNLSVTSSSDSDCSSEKLDKEKGEEEGVSYSEACQKCFVLLERLDSNLSEAVKQKDLKDEGKTLDECTNNIEECYPEKLHKIDEEVNSVKEDSENDLKRLFNMTSLKTRDRVECNLSTKTNFKEKDKKKKQVNEEDVSLLTIHNKVDEEATENGSNSCNQDSDLDIHKSFQDLEATLDSKKSKFTKEMLLLVNTTDEDTSDNQSSLKKKHRRKKKSKDHLENKENIKKEEDADEITPENDSPDADKEKNKSKNKWRHDKLLKLKLSETDTSDEERLWKKKKDEYEKKFQENNSDEPALKSRSKRRKNIIDSNSDDKQLEGTSDSNSSIEMFQVKRKKRQRSEDTDQSYKNASATDSSIGKKKIKRKRIRNLASDNSDNSSVELEVSPKAEGTPAKGRKNIRRLLKDGNVAEATKQAAREEEERRKRIAEKQRLYYELYKEVESESLDKLVLDFHPETKEEIVKVHENLVKKLKPHQVKGVKFMWDACFESVEQIKKTKGSGCILAHCMGLGKTFQVVTLIHTLLTHEITNVKTVLVVCPLNTVLNWVNEFSVWLKDTPENQTIEVYEISKFKQNYERLYKLKEWQESGGVMVLGYEMFRNLTNPAVKRVRKKLVDGFQSTLVDPGPDLIVCDEGHLLKNEDSAISKAMRRIKSLRRIVLTGTPLQNNLAEYHCMVQFVKPNLLGNRKEFNNRFVHPICNGQFEDSTAHDVRVMKRRAHVLHKMLEDSVQRFDYSVLTPFLPPKQEYVISVKLSEVQIKAYQYYLENFSARQGQELDGVLKPKGAKLFSDFQSLQQIWTHPRVMLMNAQKKEKLAEKKRLYESDSEGSLRDFITDGSDESSSNSGSSNSTSSNSTEVLPKKVTRSQIDKQISDCEIEEIAVSNGEEAAQKQSQWWEQFVTDDDFEDLRLSGKLVLLFSILQECEKIGDKLLVFSQSLFSLDLIEYFLNKIDNAAQKNESDPFLNNHSGTWTFGLDYFRLDGSTSGENRNQWCKLFNKEDNHRARLFLISTRAGGLGINLVSANRVVIFDASWNPSHDVQSIFRVYRFGQKKPCYVYRFLAQGTMEEKIYDRQVSKLSLACRVVDEHQIERHYNMSDLRELYQFNPEQVTKRPTPILPKDRLFADLLREHEQWIVTYHEHDSLLENKHEEELNEEERKAAWEDFENEKKGKVFAQSFVGPNYQPFNIQALRDLIWKENPSISEEQLQERIKRVLHYMAQYQSTNLLGSVPDGKTQDQKFNYNEHQKTNIVESNPYMQYSGSPYFQQMANVPTVSNTNVLSQQLPTKVPAHNEVYNTMISVDPGKVTSASAPRIKVKDLSSMKVVGGINSGVLLPNPYNQSINAATWSAKGSELVAQHTSEGNKIPGNITNKVTSDDSIEIID